MAILRPAALFFLLNKNNVEHIISTIATNAPNSHRHSVVAALHFSVPLLHAYCNCISLVVLLTLLLLFSDAQSR